MVVLKDKILEFHPDTLEYVRNEVNLKKQERIEEAVDLLENWVKKQRHFVKKDFSREYLERTLIVAKGLVERAKQRIDKLCTFKTLMPDMYPASLPTKDYEHLDKYLQQSYLPKLTKEHTRVHLLNATNENFESSDFTIFFRYLVVLSEYLKQHDYSTGLVVCLDIRNINIMNIVTKCPLLELRKLHSILTEGYGLRIKQIHIVTESKMVDALLSLLKQVLSSKLSGRIHLHKNFDTVYDFVPKDILPEEYGGKERPLQILNDEWRKVITSPEFIKDYKESLNAKTDESNRQSAKFTEDYIGMPGSFRVLSVD